MHEQLLNAAQYVRGRLADGSITIEDLLREWAIDSRESAYGVGHPDLPAPPIPGQLDERVEVEVLNAMNREPHLKSRLLKLNWKYQARMRRLLENWVRETLELYECKYENNRSQNWEGRAGQRQSNSSTAMRLLMKLEKVRGAKT